MPSAVGDPHPLQRQSAAVAGGPTTASYGEPEWERLAGLPGEPPVTTETTRVGVLGLQGDFKEHLAVLRDIGCESVDVRRAAQLDDVDALIIPGGESTTIGKLADLYGFTSRIRERVTEGMPVWGTCAGAIFLAKRVPGRPQPLLGLMDITVERNAFGRQIDSFETQLFIPSIGEPLFHAVFIRAPRIAEPGPGVEVLARLDDGTIVAAREGRLLATAFHPELTRDPRFHRYFCELIPRG